LEQIFEFLKALLFGIVEGVTEWLPVSSTGHMILLQEFLPLSVRPEFWEMFLVVIQLGAIFAVIVAFFGQLWPFGRQSREKKRAVWSLWAKIAVGIVPAVIVWFFLDSWIERHLYNYVTVAAALIFYGVLFILIERRNASPALGDGAASDIDFRRAALIGLFQCLAIIPGTSRSGATILGAMLLGVSRPAAAEFSFLLAVPTIAGASLVKILKFAAGGGGLALYEGGILAVGCVSAFFVSIAAIDFLVSYVKRRTFSAFGVYRIALGAVVFGYFFLR
jgi:undecaprenyl-diphosphatase